MKRALDEDTRDDAKRPRLEELSEDLDPFRPLLQRKASDIRAGVAVDESGFIRATVRMRWPGVSGRIRALLEVTEDGGTKKFQAVFTDSCNALFKSVGLDFAVADELLLSLKGATAEVEPNLKPNHLPITLVYRHGARLKFLFRKGKHSGRMVDCWEAEPLPVKEKKATKITINEDPMDWFATPATPTSVTAEVRAALNNSDVNKTTGPVPLVSVSGDTSLVDKPFSRTAEARITTPPLRSQNKSQSASMPPPAAIQTSPRKNITPPLRAEAEDAKPGRLGKKAEKAARRKEKRALKQAASENGGNQVQEQGPVSASRSENGPGEGPSSVAVPHDSILPQVSSKSAPSVSSIPPPPPKPAPPPIALDAPVKPETRHSAPGSASRPASPVKQTADPTLTLEAGFVNERGLRYTPLIALTPSSSPVCVAGVVASAAPLSLTQQNEWSRKLFLVDPSNIDEGDLTRGYSVMCFTKQRKDNIVEVDTGDIVLLRGVLVKSWMGSSNGSCPSYRQWSWSLFNPKTGSSKHGGMAILSANGSFANRDALTKLDTTEMQYCIRLGDWWTAIIQAYETRMSKAIIVQIGDEGESIAPTSISGSRAPRMHRLIKDASPDASPQGYFNCTVEILHGHRSGGNNGVYSLYVTDYTANPGLSPIDANWCKPSLSKMVLRMEFWGEGGEFAEQNMKKGDFWSLPNARMKRDSLGYLEGTISESRKFHKLDVDELEESEHLIALLARKTQWEQDSQNAGTNEFPHCLFKDANPQHHFVCTVHLLAISNKDDRKIIYVTDYTSRPDLAPVHLEPQIMSLLSGDRIVKIALFDEQAKTAGALQPGDFLTIKNLRLRPAHAGAEVNLVGRLGGDERLIYKLEPKTSASEELQELLKRKKAFQDEHKRKQAPAAATKANNNRRDKKPEPETRPVAPPSDRSTSEKSGKQAVKKASEKLQLPQLVTLREVLDYEKCPRRFRVIVRVISVWPEELEDCVRLYCPTCKEDINPKFLRCPACEDEEDDTNVEPRYRFFFQLQDRNETQLQVAVDERSAMLRDLKAVDLKSDPDALEAFEERLAPIIGTRFNLIANEGESPWLDLVIGSWMQEGGEREYVLLDVLEEDKRAGDHESSSSSSEESESE
ncbi:hypothetical protein BXZ70DRAFT_942245 [Cristinia sonorae]|uniref:Protection of telomeres protein 1 n=1 Tax=Cristinia sonorae TaxID=1940300 RepID=A0A8K0UMM5_9AGAR|nr:hypothetical protein BXZ70DRAFT_942245 [Cristinia sonorae]